MPNVDSAARVGRLRMPTVAEDGGRPVRYPELSVQGGAISTTSMLRSFADERPDETRGDSGIRTREGR